MNFKDISHDTEATYRLTENESTVFFMLNRTGELTFELAGAGAMAHIFAFFTGRDEEQKYLNLIQKHLAPDTTSSALVKAVLDDRAEFSYDGTIWIAQGANGSDATQESRSLLLSEGAAAHTKPALEILADDVSCHHAATVSPLNESMLLYAKSRGLSDSQATELLVRGFFQEATEKIVALGIEPSLIPEIH